MASIPARVFEVRRNDPLHTARVVDDTVARPGRGEALLAVERFGATSNNLTYALLGDQLGHWSPFPASGPDWGRVPAWGYAVVIDCDPDLTTPGTRWSGYLPMATHFSVRAEPHGDRLRAVSPGRAGMLPLYRDLSPLPAGQEPDDTADDIAVAMLTSSPAALLDDMIAETGPARVVVSSATSRTALTTTLLLRQRGIDVVGITSPAHVEAAVRADVYDAVVTYDAVDTISRSVDAVYLDVAGRPTTTEAIHSHLGRALRRSVAVGGSHRATQDHVGPGPAPVGPPVERFNTGARRAELVEQWGEQAISGLEDGARESIVKWASTHIRVPVTAGIDGTPGVWDRLVCGDVAPLTTPVVVPGA